MNNLLDYTLDELKVWMTENKESAFRAKQVFSWIYKNVYNFEDIKREFHNRFTENSRSL